MRVSDFFAGYLPGISFFLFLHTVIYAATWNGSTLLFFALAVVFTIVYVLDFSISRKWVFALVCMAYIALWVILWMPEMALVALGAALYSSYTPSGLRASGFRGLKKSKQASLGTDLSGKQRVYYWGYDEDGSLFIGGNKKWIIAIGSVALIIGFMEPQLLPIILRNFAIAAIFDIICRQTIRTNSFFRSYYSKGITKKAVDKLVGRGYKLILPIILCFLILGSVVLMPTYPEPVMPERVPRGLRSFDLQQNRMWNVDFDFFNEPDSGEGDVRRGENTFAAHIETILYYVAILIAIAIAGMLLYTIFKWFSKRRKQSSTQLDDFEDSIEVVDVVNSDKDTKNRKKLFSFGVNNTVRRLFIKKVREFVRHRRLSSPAKSDTPKKLVDIIEETENVEALDKLYHKARYSDDEVTRQELKELKKRKFPSSGISSIIAFVILLSMVISGLGAVTQNAQANTRARINTLREERTRLNRDIEEAQARIDDIEFSRLSKLAQKSALDDRMNLTWREIESVEEAIELYELMIIEQELEVRAAQYRENKQLMAYRSRVRSMEENGVISYLEILFDSTSFADLLARWDFISDIMRADERAYRNFINARKETEAAEEALRLYRAGLIEEKKELELREAELDEQILKANILIEELMSTLEGEEALHQQKVTESRRINAEIDRLLEQQRREEEERRRRLAAQQAANAAAGSSSGSTITGSGRLMWPASGTVISEFGMRRGRMHLGIDIMAPVGTHIFAADSGRVVRVGYNAGGWGFFIMIDHGNGMRTTYGHLNCRGIVSEGQTVSRGQLIGFMGFSGNATASAPHLHFEVRVNGVDVNPRIHLQ